MVTHIFGNCQLLPPATQLKFLQYAKNDMEI